MCVRCVAQLFEPSNVCVCTVQAQLFWFNASSEERSACKASNQIVSFPAHDHERDSMRGIWGLVRFVLMINSSRFVYFFGIQTLEQQLI